MREEHVHQFSKPPSVAAFPSVSSPPSEDRIASARGRGGVLWSWSRPRKLNNAASLTALRCARAPAHPVVAAWRAPGGNSGPPGAARNRASCLVSSSSLARGGTLASVNGVASRNSQSASPALPRVASVLGATVSAAVAWKWMLRGLVAESRRPVTSLTVINT